MPIDDTTPTIEGASTTPTATTSTNGSRGSASDNTPDASSATTNLDIDNLDGSQSDNATDTLMLYMQDSVSSILSESTATDDQGQ